MLSLIGFPEIVIKTIMQNNNFCAVPYFGLQVNNSLHLLEKGISTWSKDHSLVTVLWWIPVMWTPITSTLKERMAGKGSCSMKLLDAYWIAQLEGTQRKWFISCQGLWIDIEKVSMLSMIFTPFWGLNEKVLHFTSFSLLTFFSRSAYIKIKYWSNVWCKMARFQAHDIVKILSRQHSDEITHTCNIKQLCPWCFVAFADLTQLTPC